MIWYRNRPLTDEALETLSVLERVAQEEEALPPGLVSRYMAGVERAANAPKAVKPEAVVVWAAVLFIAATMVFRNLIDAGFIALIAASSLSYGVTVRRMLTRSEGAGVAPALESSGG